MKKLKLLFAACALLLGGSYASAYTTGDLESAGWTKVTSSSITGTGDNYYMLVDCNSSAYVMANQANNFRPCYKTIGNPVENPSFVWILEGSNNEFNLKSYSTGAYFKQASGWNTSVGYARDGRTKVTGVFELNEGKYTLKCKESGSFIGHWNDSGAAVAADGENIAANKAIGNAPGFFLYSISKVAFDAALSASRLSAVSAATKESPADVTSYIQNADWSQDWGGWESTFTSSGNMQWGQKTLESWNASNVIVKQELSGVPNGKYKVQADLISGPGATHAAFVYGTGDSKVSSDVVSVDASAGNYGTMSNEVAGNTLTADNVTVTGNTITVGIDQSTGWIVADNFKLYYYGPNLAASDALPVGDMEVGKWYYFDIAVGGSYNLTCSSLSDIVYSTDGSVLVEDAGSISTTFDASPVELTAGRYYVKSSTVQTLTVQASSYSYMVSEASTNITYIQPGNGVTVSYTVSTNDPSAELVQDYSGVKFDGAAINVTPDGSGFSFSVPANLEAGVEHTLYIPAGAIGYAAGDTYNAEQSITLTAIAIYDGVYYMYNTDTQNYLSRQGDYNTQARMDDWGLAFNVSTDANNNTKLQYFDSQLWLGDDGFCYGDCSGNRVRSFNVTKVDGGYKFLNTNNSKYLAVYDNKAVGDAVEGGNLQGTSNVWYLESTTEHKNNYTANEDEQAVSVATAAGIAGITTKAALVAELAENYGETSINITGSKAEKFQVYPGNGIDSGPVTYYSETVENLPAGLYKLSVGAFQRAASNERVAAADGARSLIYLYAGDNKTQIKSVMDYGAPSAYGGDYEYDGKHYPNNESSAYAAIETGNYQNDVYVYLAEAGSLEIGIKNPTRPGVNCSTWTVYENWTLTYYEAKATPAEKEALANAITAAEAKTLGFEDGEYAPYENVDALTALATAKAVNPETASGKEVVAATTALNNATWTANAAEVSAINLYATYDPDNKDGSGRVFAPGWGKNGGSDAYNTRLVQGAEGNPGMAAVDNELALFTKFGTTYGYEQGYTMPLKANTMYKLSFKFGAWGENKEIVNHLSVIDGESNAIAVTPESFTRENNSGLANESTEAWFDYVGFFKTNAAGNYVLTLTKDNNGEQRQIVMGNVDLKKAVAENITIAEDVDFTPVYNYANVTLNRTIKAGFNTLVLPFDMTQTEVEEQFGVGSKVYELASFDGNVIRFNYEGVDGVTANRPCILKATGAGNSYVIEDRTIIAGGVNPTATVDAVSLIGSYAATLNVTANDGNYVVSNDKLYFVDSPVTIKGTRAYFNVEGGSEARTIALSFDGITGIGVVENGEVKKVITGEIYDLMGRKVKNPSNGIYVVEGKKVVF